RRLAPAGTQIEIRRARTRSRPLVRRRPRADLSRIALENGRSSRHSVLRSKPLERENGRRGPTLLGAGAFVAHLICGRDPRRDGDSEKAVLNIFLPGPWPFVHQLASR